MRRILAISSYVARGTVGLQATVPALTRGDFEVIALPTVVLSNHPGHAACAGAAMAPETLTDMVEALERNNLLANLDAVFTGYMPSAAHVEWARLTVGRVKALNSAALYVADPILGDDPRGLYISADTAEAVRDMLLPLADLITPNRFELSWLAEAAVDDRISAKTAARRLSTSRVVATSIPEGQEFLANMFITASADAVAITPRHAHAPHGTGDYFAGLLLAALLDGASIEDALRSATLGVANAIAASQDSELLNLAALGLRGNTRP